MKRIVATNDKYHCDIDIEGKVQMNQYAHQKLCSNIILHNYLLYRKKFVISFSYYMYLYHLSVANIKLKYTCNCKSFLTLLLVERTYNGTACCPIPIRTYFDA